MTVATELAKSAHRVEYVLCIEGIGFPVDEGDLSDGFEGDVMVTADLDGDLATQLSGATIRKGLTLPTSISDRFDPETNKYSAGGLSFTALNPSSYLDDLIRPLRPPRTASAELLYNVKTDLTRASTTVELEESGGPGTFAPPNEGDVVWLGGREAVKLGTKSTISGGFSYANSTRGYLGTPRGSFDARGAVNGQYVFKAGTRAYRDNLFWHDRRVILYLHVPGEAATNLVRIYTGRVRSVRRMRNGVSWSFATVAEMFNGLNRFYEPFRNWKVKSNEFDNVSYGQVSGNPSTAGQIIEHTTIPLGDIQTARRVVTIDVDGDDVDSYDEVGLAIMYHYRTVPGGTAGAVGQIASNFDAPQAETETFETDQRYDDEKEMIAGVVRIGDRYSRALYKWPDDTASSITSPMNKIVIEGVTPELGNRFRGFFEEGEPIKLCLDNREESTKFNRFTVNGVVRKNVIDLLLMFLTTMPNEFFIADATTGGTVTTVPFTTPGFTANEWAGYAVHCVEGNNKGESRVILSNTTTTLTVDRPFSNAPTSGNEYQIRNTVYDVLPLGWGLAVHNSLIDLDTFEDIREQFCGDCEVGEFVIGDDDRISIWDTLIKHICQPYGLMPYIDRGTGKLSLRWMGSILGDGVLENYPTIGNSDLLPGSLVEFDMMPRAPMTHIRLTTRGEFSWGVPGAQSSPTDVGAPWQTGLASNSYGGSGADLYSHGVSVVPSLNSEPDVVNIRQKEVLQHYQSSDVGSLEVAAMFNSIRNIAELQKLLIARLSRQASPPPETTLNLTIEHVLTVQAGQIISVTDGGKFNAINPYALNAAASGVGWTSQLCRVLSTSIQLSRSQPSLACRVQVLESINGAKIAPAVVVTAKGGTGAGGDPYYFTVGGGTNFDEYISQPYSEYDYLDWTGLKVGDIIELRNRAGALVEGSWTIQSFGFNEASTTEDALSAQINVDSSITTSSFTETHVTFAPWDQGVNSSNMETYAAYADSANQDLDGDDAKEWA